MFAKVSPNWLICDQSLKTKCEEYKTFKTFTLILTFPICDINISDVTDEGGVKGMDPLKRVLTREVKRLKMCKKVQKIEESMKTRKISHFIIVLGVAYWPTRGGAVCAALWPKEGTRQVLTIFTLAVSSHCSWKS